MWKLSAAICTSHYKTKTTIETWPASTVPGSCTPLYIYTQKIANEVIKWTNERKMRLNGKKSNLMIFNFTKNHQFHTRVCMDNVQLDVLQETKLLGCIVTSDLKWRKNTDELVRKGYQRLLLLHKLYSFNVPVRDLVLIYVLFCRSILEFSCVV